MLATPPATRIRIAVPAGRSIRIWLLLRQPDRDVALGRPSVSRSWLLPPSISNDRRSISASLAWKRLAPPATSMSQGRRALSVKSERRSRVRPVPAPLVLDRDDPVAQPHLRDLALECARYRSSMVVGAADQDLVDASPEQELRLIQSADGRGMLGSTPVASRESRRAAASSRVICSIFVRKSAIRLSWASVYRPISFGARRGDAIEGRLDRGDPLGDHLDDHPPAVRGSGIRRT